MHYSHFSPPSSLFENFYQMTGVEFFFGAQEKCPLFPSRPAKVKCEIMLKAFLFFHFNRLWNFHPFIIYAFTLKWAEEKTVIFKLFITLQQFLVEE